MDLNKEIKLGDLFRRKAKDAEEAPEEPKPPKEPRRALFARKEKAPKQPKEPKAPKQPKESKAPKQPKESKARKEKAPEQAPKAAPAPPAIPLMRAFNLLPKEEAADRGTRLGLAQVLVALLGLLVLAGLGTGYLFMSGRVADKHAQVDDLRVQLADLDVPSEAPEDEGAGDAPFATDAEARTAALAGALTGRVAWDRVLREVTLVVPEEVWFTTVTASSPDTAVAEGSAPASTPDAGAGNSLTMAGTARSQDAVARLLARLAVIPELIDVQLQSSTAEPQENGSTTFSFSIVATVDPAGAPS
ncbi:MAG: PilN domain-containing protein [Gaiellaceae bacterium]